MTDEMDAIDAKSFIHFHLPPPPKSNSAILKTPVNSVVYNMRQPKRGKCLIFNHQNFESHTQCKPRAGSDIDAHAIAACFDRLQFTVTLINDASYKDVRETLQKVSTEDHSNSDSIAVVMLSHGDEQSLWARDHKYPTDTLFNYFRANKCASLAGKPKIFIIQACRGDNVDHGIKVRSKSMDVVDGPPPTYRIPTFADFLIYHSTAPGHFSFRNPNTGSFFIQTLVKVLDKYSRHNIDLITLLTIVNQKVAYDFESNMPNDPIYHRKKQIPCIASMLTRLVYFNHTK